MSINKPKILIDTLSLLGPLAGVGRYTYENSKEFKKLNIYKISYFYGYISNDLATPSSAKTSKSLRNWIIKNRYLKIFIRKVMFWISSVTSQSFDLYWQPNFIPNQNIKAKKIVATIHDFAWVKYPEFQPDDHILYFQKHFYTSLKKCDHIIVPSEFTKTEVLKLTDISQDKITVIYNGINHNIFYQKPFSSKPKQKYLLAVGSIEPRKNLKNLLLAYSALAERIKDEYHLILVGGSGWKNEDILEQINNLKQWVTYSGYVNDEELATLYRNSSAFIYPSIYEGFGIPPLEAMACGVPVIVSDISSMPEICSDSAIYIEPFNIQSITNGILEALNNSKLRKVLIKKGLERVKEFSWEGCARKHADVFENILQCNSKLSH